MSLSKASPATKKSIVVAKATAEKKPSAKKASTAKPSSKPAPAKSAAAKPLAIKPIAGTPVAKTKTTPKPLSESATKGNGASPITPEQRYRMICDAAYFRAERRGFIGGNSAEDWTAAEVEIDGLLLSLKH